MKPVGKNRRVAIAQAAGLMVACLSIATTFSTLLRAGEPAVVKPVAAADRSTASSTQGSSAVTTPERFFSPGESFYIQARSSFQQIHTFSDSKSTGEAREEESLVAVELNARLDVISADPKNGRVTGMKLNIRDLTRAVVGQDPVTLTAAGTLIDVAISANGEMTLTVVSQDHTPPHTTNSAPATQSPTLTVAAAQALSQTLRFFNTSSDPWLQAMSDLNKPGESVTIKPELIAERFNEAGRFIVDPQNAEGKLKLEKVETAAAGDEKVLRSQIRIRAYRDTQTPEHLKVQSATMSTTVDATLPVNPKAGRVIKKVVTRATMQVEPRPADPNKPTYHQLEFTTPAVDSTGARQTLERVEINQIELTPLQPVK